MLVALIVVMAPLLALGIFFLIEKNRKAQVSKEKHAKGKEVEYRNDGPIDYDIYIMTIKERIFYIVIAATAIYIVGFIFYRSYIISALLTPLAILYPKLRTREIIRKRKNELNLQFKEALYALSSSLSAGKSIEMAFKDCLKDLIILYPVPDTYIIREFQYIIIKLDMNETVEDALMDFASRAHMEDVSNFVDVFATSKRTGGNIVEIIKNTSKVIADKIHIKNDIETMLAEKKFEQKLLNIIPIGLILILSSNASDYMEPVFNTTFGRAMMTVSIILLGTAYVISKKIMDIEV
ncbi:type II secretion system F family protein [Wukongibacter baidiensis]|uniref:type II secretion system F family protein n=1 Tax=Wukongibacter baidiensis TaxID=1723361 RepID=UPI003D7FD334